MHEPIPLQRKHFQKKIDGRQTDLYTLHNRQGLFVEITNYGGRMVSFWAKNQHGNWADIVLGYANLETYLHTKDLYFGAIVGRYANRIAKGTFTLQGKKYQINTNDGKNHLHGGGRGFDKVVWHVEKYTDTFLQLSYVSQEGEEGYPGKLNIVATYELLKNNTLRITYQADSDQPTLVNLTHHSYFNLKGAGNGNIYNHQLQLFSENYLPVDKDLIPLGTIEKTAETPLDFSTPKPIGQDIHSEDLTLKLARGYDHCYVLSNKDPKKLVAAIYEPNAQRTLKIYTNQPAVQFYTGNYITGAARGKQNKIYKNHDAFCLEPGALNNSCNVSDFPSTVLYPKEQYHWVSEYQIT